MAPRNALHITHRTTQSLTAPELEALWNLFCQMARGDRTTFVHGLLALHEVFLACDEREIVGFGGVNVFKASYRGETATLIYTARVCLHPRARAANLVQRAGLHYFLREKRAHPTRPVYWLFCAGSYKSYLLLPRNLRTYWPRPGAELPERERGLILDVARQMNDPGFDPVALTMFEEGVVYEGGNTALAPEALADPDVTYYARRIAPLRRGEEILCLAPLTATNWLAVLGRMGQRRWRHLMSWNGNGVRHDVR